MTDRKKIEEWVSSWAPCVHRWSLEKKVVIGFSSALFFLVLIGLLQYRSMRRVVRNNARVSRAEVLLSELDGLLAASLEAERDCAFYIFTGYLQSYLEAVPHVERHLHNIEVLTADDQDRRTRLEVLKPLVVRDLARLNDLVQLRVQSGADDARAAIQNEEGTKLAEDIRNTVRQMESEERMLLRRGNNAAEAGVSQTAWLSGLAIVLAIAILLLSGWVIHLDISARKQVEEERDRLWTLSNDLIVVAGPDGYVKRLSPSWQATLGFTLEELTAKPYVTYVHPDDRQRFVAEVEKLKASGAIASPEVRMLCQDGSFRWMIWRLALPSGTDTVYAVAHDITEGKRGEAEMQELLASIVQFSDDAIIGTDLDGTILTWNQGAERIYGYSADEVKGKLASVLMPAERADELVGIMERVRGGEAVDHFETVRVRKEGNRIDVSATISPIRDATGRVVGASTVARDITEYKRAEEEIRKLNENLERRVLDRTAELQAINRELEAFTYSVSHDLRAPLRHIAGFSKLLHQESGLQLDASAQHFLKRIDESTQTMERLIDGLLKLARVSRQDLERRPVLLSSVLEEVLQELRPEYDGREIEWRIGLLPVANCDPGLIKLVFVNLLSNAIKFTRPRQNALIEVHRVDWEDQMVVRVRDNGAGFDMKYADKLFGAFQRLHRADEFEGTGVGLATVQRIVHRHGGRVWAEAESGKGATFYFALPVASQPSKAFAAAAAQ